MIFVGGVHGVGKTHFCSLLKERLGIPAYSASQLISDVKQSGFSPDKRVADIDENQMYLLEAIDNLRSKGSEFLLDGHFCLLNADSEIIRISENTFIRLNPDAIVLITENSDVIAKRRFERDHVEHKADDIARFQEAEISYAREIAGKLGIPLIVSYGSNDVNETIEFIRGRM